MKKVLRSFAALAVTALTLTSCLSKTTYAEFKEKADEAYKVLAEYTTVKFSGKYTYSGATVDMTDVTFTQVGANVIYTPAEGTSIAQAALGTFLVENTANTVVENSSLNYYVGGGFKIENTENTKQYTEWNEYGLLTAISNGTNTIKATWSK